MIYPSRPACQLHSIIWEGNLKTWLQHRALNLRSQLVFKLRQATSRKRTTTKRLGAPSRFPPGTWVRVLDEDRIRATLDTDDRLLGLKWNEQLWPYCGTVHRVSKQVRRILDDNVTLRPVSRTVLLDVVTCGGETGLQGCGRECPMMFRDEWLEEAEPPPENPQLHDAVRLYATVRDADAIRQTLDATHSLQGLVLMPEMYQYAGRRYPVLKQVDRVWGPREYLPAKGAFYILDGLHCAGLVHGDAGPCDRGCRLLWHKDWLEIEEPVLAQGREPDGSA